jgi:hypothetical protein
MLCNVSLSLPRKGVVEVSPCYWTGPVYEVWRIASFAGDYFGVNIRFIKDRARIFAATAASPAHGGQLFVNHFDHFTFDFEVVLFTFHLALAASPRHLLGV